MDGVERRAPEPQLAAVDVAIEQLAYAVGVRLALVGLETTRGDHSHVGIEIVEEDRDHGVACALGVLDDVDRPVIG
jgi:hypothetical protein